MPLHRGTFEFSAAECVQSCKQVDRQPEVLMSEASRGISRCVIHITSKMHCIQPLIAGPYDRIREECWFHMEAHPRRRNEFVDKKLTCKWYYRTFVLFLNAFKQPHLFQKCTSL